MLAKFEEYSQSLEKELREKVGFRMAISFVLSYVMVVHNVLRQVLEAMKHGLLVVAGVMKAELNLDAQFDLHKQFLGLNRRLHKLTKADEMKAELENLVKAHSAAFGELPPPPPALTVLTTAQRAPAAPTAAQLSELPKPNSNHESDDDAEDDTEADTEADDEDNASSPDDVGESISSTITFINLEVHLLTKISSQSQHSLLCGVLYPAITAKASGIPSARDAKDMGIHKQPAKTVRNAHFVVVTMRAYAAGLRCLPSVVIARANIRRTTTLVRRG
ncbi:unnamed protein product [Parascedosporium putredinis]|uniref:Uncharacterized protein n=1 Tax=Parascedosporium putredinis TaxID=1442378 RepID=A0A9P1GWR9_9PEZI|nr:unnamed protein product [Parascedosporium putredinis]CAI7989044.1 unnamed protein product [Parascedosporium putredinis]